MNEVITNNREKCDQALAALHHVIDPEIGLNIVDLGLLYQIDFDEGNKIIFVSMTLTTQFCPMGESITNAATETLKSAFPGTGVSVELSFDPSWSHERISAEGQEFLNER